MRPDETSRPALTLVVGFDDQEAGRAAVQAAVDLARRLSAALHVVHAVEPALPPVGASATVTTGTFAPPDAYLTPEQLSAAGDAAREALTALLRDVDVPWTWAGGTGRAADVVAAAAEEVDAYLVVVGARPQSLGVAVEHLLTGSTVKELRRRVTRPLLLVPVDDEPEA